MTSRATRRIIVAPTAFKGTLGPGAVARAMAAGVRAVWPESELLERPLSDGGNGLLEAVLPLEGGELEEREVCGPLGDATLARWLRVGRTAVIESAEACGLHLMTRLDPLHATTRGVGELVHRAVAAGAQRVVLGLGGSATVDGGTGMARALGWRFLDERGAELAEGGGALGRLTRIEAPPQPLEAPVVALCDVENPLAGPAGAARVYGPQKGAGWEAVEILDEALARLATVVETKLGLRVVDVAGSGAAGGLGAGAMAFLHADLVSGAEWMIERSGLVGSLEQADLVVTGEGRFDAQSAMGKLTGRVLTRAAEVDVPVVLVCGQIEGSPPAGVLAVDGGGRMLDESEIERLAESACRALVGGDRL